MASNLYPRLPGSTFRKGTLRIYMQKRYFTCSVLMKYCSTESFNIIILYFVHVLLNTISPIIYQSKSCKRMYKNNTRENVSRIIFRLSNFEMKIILAFFLPLLRRNPECLPKYSFAFYSIQQVFSFLCYICA